MPQYMHRAIELAKKAYQADEVPVGAVITENDIIIAEAHNLVETKNSPLQHAEMIAIEKALQHKNTKYLDNCNLYVTLEPCALCAAAIAATRIKCVYIGVEDPKMGAILNGPKLFTSDTIHHKLEVVSGIEEEQCKILLKEFFKSKRA